MLVIGAGISGALVAEAVGDAGLDVLVVDRRGPLRGSTAASTALLQYDSDTPLTHVARRLRGRKAVVATPVDPDRDLFALSRR